MKNARAKKLAHSFYFLSPDAHVTLNAPLIYALLLNLSTFQSQLVAVSAHLRSPPLPTG
jgi:hypothetical protein